MSADNLKYHLRQGRRTWVALPVLALAILLLGLMGEYYQSVLVSACLFGYLSLSWNVSGGFAGSVSFGHTIFVAIGAYMSAFLFSTMHLSPWFTIPIAMGVSALIAGAVGYVIFKTGLRHVFFSMITFAAGQMALYLVLNLAFLGAGQGYLMDRDVGIGNFQFNNRYVYLVISVVLLCLGVTVCQIVRYSRFGYRLVAIREEEDAADALGIDAVREQTFAFMLSAALTAVGGVFYAQFIMYLDPQSVAGVVLALQIVVFALVGGSQAVWGPVVGALILYPVSEGLRVTLSGLSGIDLVFYGVVLVATVILMPRGLVGVAGKVWISFRKVSRRRTWG